MKEDSIPLNVKIYLGNTLTLDCDCGWAHFWYSYPTGDNSSPEACLSIAVSELLKAAEVLRAAGHSLDEEIDDPDKPEPTLFLYNTLLGDDIELDSLASTPQP